MNTLCRRKLNPNEQANITHHVSGEKLLPFLDRPPLISRSSSSYINHYYSEFGFRGQTKFKSKLLIGFCVLLVRQVVVVVVVVARKA